MAQLGSAPALGAGGRRFKSSHSDSLTWYDAANKVDRSDHVSIKFSISEHESAARRRVCWKGTGQPTVRKHREKWTVRIEGIETETDNRRPRQIGTCAL